MQVEKRNWKSQFSRNVEIKLFPIHKFSGLNGTLQKPSICIFFTLSFISIILAHLSQDWKKNVFSTVPAYPF
jgi:hypothetical protein